jgi:hypothetical protein
MMTIIVPLFQVSGLDTQIKYQLIDDCLGLQIGQALQAPAPIS